MQPQFDGDGGNDLMDVDGFGGGRGGGPPLFAPVPPGGQGGQQLPGMFAGFRMPGRGAFPMQQAPPQMLQQLGGPPLMMMGPPPFGAILPDARGVFPQPGVVPGPIPAGGQVLPPPAQPGGPPVVMVNQQQQQQQGGHLPPPPPPPPAPAAAAAAAVLPVVAGRGQGMPRQPLAGGAHGPGGPIAGVVAPQLPMQQPPPPPPPPNPLALPPGMPQQPPPQHGVGRGPPGGFPPPALPAQVPQIHHQQVGQVGAGRGGVPPAPRVPRVVPGAPVQGGPRQDGNAFPFQGPTGRYYSTATLAWERLLESPSLLANVVSRFRLARDRLVSSNFAPSTCQQIVQWLKQTNLAGGPTQDLRLVVDPEVLSILGLYEGSEMYGMAFVKT